MWKKKCEKENTHTNQHRTKKPNYMKILFKSLVALSLSVVSLSASAQCYTAARQQAWLQKAEACKPALQTTVHHPVQEVEVVKD